MKLPSLVIFMLIVSLTSIQRIISSAEDFDVSSEVPEDTTTTLAGDELEKVLKEIETNMKNMVNTAMKHMQPFAVKIGFNSYASLRCLLDLSRIITGVKKLEAWAFKLVDASGKISGGLMEGTSSALGDYDECLEVVSPGRNPLTGEYCLLEIKPPQVVVDALKDYQIHKGKFNDTLSNTKTFLQFFQKIRTNPDHVIFRFGICAPSSCHEDGLQSIIDIATEDIDMPIEVVRCEYKDEFELETHQILIISVITICIVLVLLATVISIAFTKENVPSQSATTKPIESSTSSNNEYASCSKVIDICSRLSLWYNIRKLFDSSSEEDAADSIRGLKVLTTIFAIFTHTYALPHPLHLYRFRNTLNFTKFIDEVLFGAVANSSVGVDTFFFLAGFHFIYNRWRLTKRPQILNYIVKFVVLTYIRMLVIQILVGSLFFLFPVFGSGPLWEEFVEEPLNNCRKSWWMNLLFIQNFLGPYDICLYQTWIMATMMQIFVITSVIAYILHRWPVYGVFSIIMTIISAMMAVATVTAVAGYPASFTVYFYDYRTTINVWKYLYTQFYTHIGPQCIGMLTAYIITEYSSRKIDKRLVIPLWIVCFVTLSSITFGLHAYRHGEAMVRALAIFYAALHRPAWTIAIGWVIYSCAIGYGGIMNNLLSWKAFIPMERLCYLAYLLHIPLMYYQGGVQRERMFMGHYNQVMCFLAYAVASFFLAFICYLLFQAPYEAIEEMIFNKFNRNTWKGSPASVSQVTLQQSTEGEKATAEEQEDRSKVLYNRYVETEHF